MTEQQNQQISPPPPPSDITYPEDITQVDEGRETLTQNNHNVISQPTPMNIPSLPGSSLLNIVNVLRQNDNFITPLTVRSTSKSVPEVKMTTLR